MVFVIVGVEEGSVGFLLRWSLIRFSRRRVRDVRRLVRMSGCRRLVRIRLVGFASFSRISVFWGRFFNK